MQSFSNFLQGFNKKFVGLFFTRESEEALRDWAMSVGFDLTTKFNGSKQDYTEFDFHTTVFFTTSEHDNKNGSFELDPFELQFDHFELLGVEKNIPVIKLSTDNVPLMNLRKRFEDMGYQDAWPAYKPHISLSYNYNGTPDISKLMLPSVKVFANKIKITDQ